MTARRQLQFRPGGIRRRRPRVENGRVHPQVHGDHVGHAPIRQHCPQGRAGHQGAGEFAVERPDVTPGDVHHHLFRRLAEVLGGGAEKSLGKVRMVKPDHRNAERIPRGQRLPGHLVRVARLNDVGLFLLQDSLDGLEVDQSAVARPARHQWGADRVNAGRSIDGAFRLGSRDDQDMLVAGVVAQVICFLGEVALHPAANRGVKLGQVADFQWTATSSAGARG